MALILFGYYAGLTYLIDFPTTLLEVRIKYQAFPFFLINSSSMAPPKQIQVVMGSQILAVNHLDCFYNVMR